MHDRPAGTQDQPPLQQPAEPGEPQLPDRSEGGSGQDARSAEGQPPSAALDPNGVASRMLTPEQMANLTAEQVTRIQRAEELIAESPRMIQIQRGNIFNIANEYRYSINELHVTGGGRLDSVELEAREIVERKYTQLAQISIKSGRSYLNDFLRKYPLKDPDVTIADTPTNRRDLESAGLNPDHWIGKPLDGQRILEVPEQKAPPPLIFLQDAAAENVQVRDIYGTVWRPSTDGESIIELRADGTIEAHPVKGDSKPESDNAPEGDDE